jgi:hypothetical protein
MTSSSYDVALFEVDGVMSYRAKIATNARALWNGSFTLGAFIQGMELDVGNGLTLAWNEGAAECGIFPNDFTQEEINERDAAILLEYSYIASFADFIMQNSKANGGLLRSLQFRINMWANRYRDLRNRAKAKACADKKLKWLLGPTEEHCDDCSNYAGRVYRASIWNKYNIKPQSRELSCKGYNCQCDLVPTDEPGTPGRPPAMTG